jgi:spoIIIJ-associated protein
MEELEITARTVEQAIEEAEKQLGIDRSQIEILVVRKGKSGILGMGSEEAIIKVKPTIPPEKDVVKVATEVLDRLLQLMGIIGKVKSSSSEIPLTLNVEGDDLGILIGRSGKTLTSLEYIVKLVVAGQLKAWLPLRVDVAEYKKRRRDSLQKLALRLAEQVKLRHRAMTLEPMPADERRIIHLALADHPDVVTHSIGESDDRKVVILLKQGYSK